MEHKWYGTTDSWPRHGAPLWDQALERARRAGWHLITFSGHTWGKVVCSRAAEEPHEKLIFSTGRGGENHARDLLKLIARCHHPRDDEEPVDYSKAQRLLDSVELLLAAAERCLAAERKQAHAEDLLDLGDAGLRDANEAVARAIQAEEGLEDDMVNTYTLAARAGYPSDAPHTTQALVAQAEARLDTARTDVEGTLQSPQRTALLARAAALRDEVTNLRARMHDRGTYGDADP